MDTAKRDSYYCKEPWTLAGTNFALGSYEKFKPAFQDKKKGQRFWRRVLVRNSRKKATRRNTAGNGRRCNPGRYNSSRWPSWNVNIGKFSAHLLRCRLEKPSQSREPRKPALSYEHIENFANDLEACEEALRKGVAEKKQILQLACDWPEDSHWFSYTSS